METYFSRADYYGAVGFDEMAYLVLDFFKNKPDEIRSYDLVLIDEFQDFNMLEVELVNMIEIKNNMVIVGDDDQAIYDFRGASPKYLREKHNNNKYITYTLPFCSRCTKVVVDTVNDIIRKAQKNNILLNRINKSYKCYLPEKQDDSNKYCQIIHKEFTVQRKNANYMGNFISFFYENTIDKNEKELAIKNKKTLILIIGQRQFLDQVYQELLNHIQLSDMSYKRKAHDKSMLCGLKMINGDNNSNLGWRIIAEEKLKKQLNKIIKDSSSSNIIDAIPKETINSCNDVIKILNKTDVSDDEKRQVTSYIGSEDYEAILNLWKSEELESILMDDKSPLIKLTTFEGSKGLAADYVFIVGLHEGILPRKSTPNEGDICRFIVAITRTKKLCHILTCRNFSGTQQTNSQLISWISNENLSYELIDAKKIVNYKLHSTK